MDRIKKIFIKSNEMTVNNQDGKVTKTNEVNNTELQDNLAGKYADDLNMYFKAMEPEYENIPDEEIFKTKIERTEDGYFILTKFNLATKEVAEKIIDDSGRVVVRVYDNPRNEIPDSLENIENQYVNYKKLEYIEDSSGYYISKFYDYENKRVISEVKYKDGDSMVFNNLPELCVDEIVSKDLLNLKKGNGKNLTEREISFIVTHNFINFNLLKEKIEEENSDKPVFYIYETMMGYYPTESFSTSINNNIYSSALANLEGEEYEAANRALYGDKTPKIQNLLDEFQRKHLDIKLLTDNDVTFEKAKEIVKIVDSFVTEQEKAKLPYAKVIQFTKLGNMDGMYRVKDTIYISIDGSIYCLFNSILHENGHFRDYKEWNYENEEIPDNVKPILKKLLGEYSATEASESIAELIAKIELPESYQNPFRPTMHVRIDENNNYILMVGKDCNVKQEELNLLGAFFRSKICPKVISDYDANKHGDLSKYNETVIRNEDEIILNLFGPSAELYSQKIKDRNLLDITNNEGESLSVNMIKLLSFTSDETWNKIRDRNLLTLKNADNEYFKYEDIDALARLDENLWNIALNRRKLFDKKDATGKAFTGRDITFLACIKEDNFGNIGLRYLDRIVLPSGKALNGMDIFYLSLMDANRWYIVDRAKLLERFNMNSDDISLLFNLDAEQIKRAINFNNKNKNLSFIQVYEMLQKDNYKRKQ